jgi:acetyltransferase EpsM
MTSPTDLVVLGGGDHARMVIEAAQTRPDLWRVAGFIDPMPCPETLERYGVRRLAESDENLPRTSPFDRCSYVLGVGRFAHVSLSAEYRREIVRRLGASEDRWGTIVHAKAVVSPKAVLGPGVVILPGAIVNAGAVLDAHAVVNTGAVVEHDVRIGAFTHVAPGATIGAATRVGDACTIGLGARVRERLSIGNGATVGMGAVVVSSVPEREVVVGVPARATKGGSRDD